MRTSRLDPGIVHLALSDQHVVPECDEVLGWVAEATTLDTGMPVGSVRTGALFPDAAQQFADAGFVTIDTLALLRIDLDTDDLPHREGPPPRTGALRPRHHEAAAAVDRAAFGDPVGNDGHDLGDIRRATPVQRAQARFAGPLGQRRLIAFAITGAARHHGYLQRLAVDPAAQGCGHGRALVVDALRWMDRRRLIDGVVNTGVGNAAALALYAGLGFQLRPEQLQVMQLDLAST